MPGFGTTRRAKVRVGVFAQLDYFLFADQQDRTANVAPDLSAKRVRRRRYRSGREMGLRLWRSSARTSRRLVLSSDQREGRSRSAERVEAQPSKPCYVRK